MRPGDLSALVDATWPAASFHEAGGWVIREGRGAGSRVSAATARVPGESPDRAPALDAMAALGQRPVFMVRPGEEALDAALERDGYGLVSPTLVQVAPVAQVAGAAPDGDLAEIWPPSGMERAIWAAGGIGPARVAVMERVRGAKTACTLRAQGAAVATGFAAMHDGMVVLHAIETLAAHRRRGHARRVVAALARWGARQGAEQAALLVVESNGPANALYAAMGFAAREGYHYRAPPEAAG